MKNILAFAVLAAGSAAAQATIVDWATWTSAGAAGPASSAAGNINAVGVTYTGEINFTQINNTGFDYWRDNTATPYPAYVSGDVTNVPSTVDLIAISGNGTSTNTVTFSQPVVNPYMAIVSLGQPGIGTTYFFDAPFSIVSFGQAYWGNGTLTNAGGNINGGHTLVGFEGQGVIQFMGTFSSISWTTTSGEHWNGFNFGIPTPGAAALLGIGSLSVLRRRR